MSSRQRDLKTSEAYDCSIMKNEVTKNPLDQSDPLAESLGFAGFDAIDLLRFVESEMGDEEQIAFIEQVRSGDAMRLVDLLG